MPDNVPVTMIREDLNAIPQFGLPASSSFRWFQPGDERIWQEIQAKADPYNEITEALFARQFGPDVDLLRERQGFLLDAKEKAIATATAWLDDNYQGQPFGRLHWVAVVPEMQGRGLAKPLLSIICNRLQALGHKRVYLTTSSARIPAINLYLNFGFLPKLTTQLDHELWEEIGKEVEKERERRPRNEIYEMPPAERTQQVFIHPSPPWIRILTPKNNNEPINTQRSSSATTAKRRNHWQRWHA